MSNKSVKIQQVVMTVLSVFFLVGVGYYGNKNKKVEDESTEVVAVENAVEHKEEEIVENQVAIEEVKEEEKVEEVATLPALLLLQSKYHTYTREYVAKVKLKYSTPVRETVEGRIVSILAREGQMVSEGQAIYDIEVGSLNMTKKERDRELNEYKNLKKDIERAENKMQKLARKDTTAFLKQRQIVDDLRQQLKTLNESINGDNKKYTRYTIKAEREGIVRNLNLRVGDVLAANDKNILYNLVGYDVYFDIPSNELPQWKRGLAGEGQTTVVSSFEGVGGQRVPFKLNIKGDSELVFLDKSSAVQENLKLRDDGGIDNKIILSIVYKDVIEIPVTAISIDPEGRQEITVINGNGDSIKKAINPIRKYASYVLVSDSSLEGTSIRTGK
ncbi:efflux RND transporter periplasmic adaptor subunit [Myroides marinus]|uniref:efflux RND transporter periplasmic adaptor subunit n=1 Tax=Myroides marinus TaxID=703342 RepID=UPI0025775B20|nr:efflux RND transporter periplasmic adaptor subunit [Myroides marinus]MDM1369027.1 efflux RND transporter periplasmic adaptor subunit [Myroides marinus]MDM1372741.1 efflux RND transporter periplasmic adaptor subunit [Myroides marinus]MDM1375866.1 efflux RND transporter periplasmic adaptor subunit [Myroides marinus]MDM1384533.1 efflux RND transporter periplasmic adaptor subunit [Myroides marinus]